MTIEQARAEGKRLRKETGPDAYVSLSVNMATYGDQTPVLSGSLYTKGIARCDPITVHGDTYDEVLNGLRAKAASAIRKEQTETINRMAGEIISLWYEGERSRQALIKAKFSEAEIDAHLDAAVNLANDMTSTGQYTNTPFEHQSEE